MAAVSPDHRIEQLQNTKLFQTVARGLLTVIGQESDPETSRCQTVKWCRNIPLRHRIAMHKFTRKPPHFSLIAFIFGKGRHIGRQQRLPGCPDIAKGSGRTDTERINLAGGIIDTYGIEKIGARQHAGSRVGLQCQSVVGKRLHHRKPGSDKIEDHTILVENKRAYHFITPGLTGNLGPPGQAPRGFWRSRFTDSTTGW
jgi:hypothetical protein